VLALLADGEHLVERAGGVGNRRCSDCQLLYREKPRAPTISRPG
jgi:hypothetical protein